MKPHVQQSKLVNAPWKIAAWSVSLSLLVYSLIAWYYQLTWPGGFILAFIMPLLSYPIGVIVLRYSKQLHEAHQEIARQKAELEKANGVKDRLFSLVAHEMRGPINTLEGLLLLLDDESLNKDEFKAYSQNLLHNVRSTSEMLDGLLIWAKSQMEGLEPKPMAVVVSELLSKVLQQVKPKADEKDITFQLSNEEQLTILADPHMMELVMRNLIANAIKFTPNGGAISLSSNAQDGGVTLEVSDNGVGMESDQVERLFNPQFQVSNPGTNQEKGFGLGLLICYDFVKMNQGKIAVSSEKGKGTSFTIHLPAPKFN